VLASALAMAKLQADDCVADKRFLETGSPRLRRRDGASGFPGPVDNKGCTLSGTALERVEPFT